MRPRPRTGPKRAWDSIVSRLAYSGPSPSHGASASTSKVSATATAAPPGQSGRLAGISIARAPRSQYGSAQKAWLDDYWEGHGFDYLGWGQSWAAEGERGRGTGLAPVPCNPGGAPHVRVPCSAVPGRPR